MQQLDVVTPTSETEARSNTIRMSRTQQLGDMLQVNTDLCFLSRGAGGQRDERLFQGKIH